MERRRAARRIPNPDEPISRARLRTGHDLDVIDISNIGAQVEGLARLLPGTHIDLHVVTSDGRVLVRSRIVRSFVCRLQADLVRYRAGLTFETVVDTATPGYEVPHIPAVVAAGSGMAYPSSNDAQARPYSVPLAPRDLRDH